MDGDRLMLDLYDCPIRDFTELPATICYSEKGLFIECYPRRNREFKPYDLFYMSPPSRDTHIIEKTS